jgi:LytS/YehU family sensor histidine kinase
MLIAPRSNPHLAARPWVELCVPVRFLNGDGALILLGRRDGGRRYLSEDLQEISRLAAVVAEQVEQFRRSELQRLISQAELRALQAQINPHFLFNSLNTLYGTIPRSAADARGMVVNLAQIFRYFLQTDRTLIPLEEEVQIVRAYLAIETLRLGDRLRTEIEIDESAGRSMIPILSMQPLVENAVKHGVAARSGPGTVRVRATSVSEGVLIRVSDDGGGLSAAAVRGPLSGGGVGLDYVRQRLRLCFGDSAWLNIESTEEGCTVQFLIPNQSAVPAVSEGVTA